MARLREPFLLLVGYGRTGELLGRSFDALGRRFVVLDGNDERIDALDLASYHADVPGLVADARNPGHLGVAGLANPQCEAVLALTNDDEANLAVDHDRGAAAPGAAGDRPHHLAGRSRERMRAFGSPTVVDPFDRFGDHLRIALRAPATYQLMMWLESGPGAELPPRGSPPAEGRWVMCGYGRFGRHLTEDLRAEGLEVTIVEPKPIPDDRGRGGRRRVRAGGDGAGRGGHRGRVRGRHRQRHHQPVADRRRPPGQPRPVGRRPAEPADQRVRCSR